MNVGDIVMYGGIKTSYVGRSPRNPDKHIGEVVEVKGVGWRRDGDVPSDYEPKYTNSYFFVSRAEIEKEINYQIF